MAGKMTRAIRHQNVQLRRERRNLPHLTARLCSPLLVDGRKLEHIMPVFMSKINGEPAPQLSDGDYRDDGGIMSIDTASGIAVIPILGSLIRRPTWLDAWSGLTSYSMISESIDNALSDARVKGILLQVDSFGGEAPGCFELCDKIFAARSQKPIWASADVDALSAGYALLSSAEQCFADPSGSVGSIGVVAVHVERSKQNAAMGVTYTVLRAGERKAEFNPYEQLSPDAAARLLTSMDKTRDRFASTVSRNRGIGIADVLNTEGQYYDPDDAVEMGLINGLAVYEDVFSQFADAVSSPSVQVVAPVDDDPAPTTDLPDDDNNDDGDTIVDPDDLPEDEPQQNANSISEVIEMTTQTRPPGNAGNAIPPNPAASPNAPQSGQGAEVVMLPVQESREKRIATMCKLAGRPELTADFIISEKTAEAVQDELINMRAQANAQTGDISNSHENGNTTAHAGFGMSQRQAHDKAVASWGDAFTAARKANPVGFPQYQAQFRPPGQ